MSEPLKHSVVMTIRSTADGASVDLKLQWDPDLKGLDIEELGYYPAAYKFLEEYILPAVEEALLDTNIVEYMFGDEPPKTLN